MASEAASASSSVTYTGGKNIEVFPWLKTLPLAPEYHPTLAEFQDPISYIFKIEKEASKFGICKIVPPIPPPPKKTAIVNLNKSISARSGSGPTFTTRQQQIGFCPRKHRPVKKPVWQSGENYTVAQFEVKAKGFEKNYLKKCSKKNLSPLEIETLYWKATVDKPFSVEYANDVPGSAFAPKKIGKEENGGEGSVINNNNVNVGETEWNMRGVSRAKGSLLKFMKEEIPGVTSPMVYIAMMFSWFAWHVEDHDLHSLNYHHMGAGKTWYGVPRDAAVAFEEVIRVHGYGGEINPIVTFATLGEKTTVMSPEVLIDAGVPCCRLVQNPGEFVVTFPRAYHSGFSHGFNCGEAANIATPEWLRLAKDAAIRRASTNCPPMVSHYQLLYDLALSISSRVPKNIHLEPRSSRLKDKKKDEGELLVKDLFVQDMMQNSDLLHMLADGSSVVVLQRNSLGTSVSSNLKAGPLFQLQARYFSAIGSPDLAMTTSKSSVYDLERKRGTQPGIGAYSRGKFAPSFVDKRLSCSERAAEVERDARSDRLSEQGLFSCVTCGILCFACVAIIQPTDAAANYLTTADCSTFKDWEETSDAFTSAALGGDENLPESVVFSQGRMHQRNPDGLFDVLVQSAEQIELTDDESVEVVSSGDARKGTSSLGLLALAYGNSSDSEEDLSEADVHTDSEEDLYKDSLPQSLLEGDNEGSAGQEATSYRDISNMEINCLNEIPLQSISMEQELTRCRFDSRSQQSLDWPAEHKTDSFTNIESDNLRESSRHQFNLQHGSSSFMPLAEKAETTKATGLLPFDNTILPFSTRSDEDSSRMHVFCLQHAVQVEKHLRSIGGSRILLLCHPDYPKVEAEAKKLAEELGNDHSWSDISFKEASREDEEKIRLALESEEAIHGNGDWAVKLGINLYYSANLSRSPLYSKQMPYNFIIYNAFGRSSPASPTKAEFNGKGPGKLKNVAGKWCGKVWMSNQVHPLLAERDHGEAKKTRTPSRVKVDLKLERPSESIRTVETASRICRSDRKRKSRAEIRPATKEKSLKADEQDKASDDSSMECPLQRCKSNLKNKRMKKEKPEPCIRSWRNKNESNIEIEASDDSSMEGSLQQCKSNMRNKQMKKEKPEPRTRSARSQKELNIATEASDDSSMEGPLQQCKSNLRSKRMKKEKPEPHFSSARNQKEFNIETEASDNSSMEGPLRQCKSNLRNKLLKKEKTEPPIRFARNKRELNIEIEDEPKARNECVKNKKDLNMEIEDESLPRNKYGKNKKEFKVENDGEQKPRNKGTRSKRELNLEDEDDPNTPRMRSTRDKRQVNLGTPKDPEGGPSARLRKRPSEPSEHQRARSIEAKPTLKKQQKIVQQTNGMAARKAAAGSKNSKAREEKADFSCDLEGCTMSFGSKQELALHKRNICPVKGCGKKFLSHKYSLQHRRVHVDERPLKCPWKGCKMTFKWAWARTEHIRVHTGARPYVCTEAGCGQTFRFVSDFSRHKRKTGHISKKGR